MNRPERVEEDDIVRLMHGIGRAARMATTTLANAPTETKNLALTAAAKALRARRAQILAANGQDLAAARDRGTAGSFLDRLTLDELQAVDTRWTCARCNYDVCSECVGDLQVDAATR